MRKIFFVLLLLPSISYSATYYEKFIEALLINDNNISSFIDKDELKKSNRLGIIYENIYKPLISFDIEQDVKEKIKNEKLSYKTEEKEKDNEYTLVLFRVPGLNYAKNFYFKNEKFIYPSTYYTRKWQTYESRYFIFRVSEPEFFNDRCIMFLDIHAESMGLLLDLSHEERTELADKKIYYTFCKDQNEVELITGYKAKGMYVTANDEIVSAYPTHYHELSHLMINYKLRHLNLYTNPFMLEGFAVASGGRGGLGCEVMKDMGWFLLNSGFAEYKMLTGSKGFYSEDASISYSAAGLFNQFLLDELVIESYLELYKKSNGTLKHAEEYIPVLPYDQKFISYLNSYNEKKAVNIEAVFNANENPELKNKYFTWEEKGNRTYFYTSVPVIKLYPKGFKASNYKSRLFEELTGERYNGEAYLILTDTNSVKLYCCLNDELIASYDRSFDIMQRKVPYNASDDKGYYKFSIKSDVFRVSFE